jgi:ABC-type transport system substrate-binding protein
VGEFNLDKARQLLASAGYPDGFETKIQAATVYSEEVQFDQVVQADLATIGINAAIEPLDSASATSALAQGSFSALFSYAYAYADADPAMAFTSFPFRPHNNASHFQSDEYSMMVDAARREPDPTKRIALYRGIATYLKDQAFVLPLANSTVALAMRANVHGFIRQPLFTVPVLEEIWLA